ncbi:MAG: 4Fe-4S binding protein [Candidatus Micrarchaeota archaeon]
MGKRVLITVPGSVTKDPIIADTILKTGVVFNIISTELTLGGGSIVGNIEADEEKTGEFIRILKRRGVAVKELESTITFLPDRCVSCGLCVTLCKPEAIGFGKDWKIGFDFNKCILCLECVKNCPVKAVRYLG